MKLKRLSNQCFFFVLSFLRVEQGSKGRRRKKNGRKKRKKSLQKQTKKIKQRKLEKNKKRGKRV